MATGFCVAYEPGKVYRQIHKMANRSINAYKMSTQLQNTIFNQFLFIQKG